MVVNDIIVGKVNLPPITELTFRWVILTSELYDTSYTDRNTGSTGAHKRRKWMPQGGSGCGGGGIVIVQRKKRVNIKS